MFLPEVVCFIILALAADEMLLDVRREDDEGGR